MLGKPGSYANKKRKKPVLKQKKLSDGHEVVKSNPSKRHRDRLNGELDRLTDLLPFSEEICSRLDKLSVLRLSVGYLRVKSYFNATMKTSNNRAMFPGVDGQNVNNMNNTGFTEGDLLLQALNGFVTVVTSDGLVFYVSPTIKDYLGFHQSDVVHQSVFELIHTDDRAMFRQQLHFALNPPTVGPDGDDLQSHDNARMYSPEQLPPENSSFLERSFVCRFRCLLDNSSGFLALKFQGRLKYLHGQRPCDKPQLALFTIATPFQPASIVEIRTKMLLFQSKHKLDFTPISMDSRGRIILGYSESELCTKGSGYQFIHAADMMYCADSHVRMIKTGETGLIVFRLLSKSGGWVWVKSNAKLYYKEGRPEFIIAYQTALTNLEGEEYLRQRRLQLPFSVTTGEAILYNTGPTVDISQFQFNKMFSNNDMQNDVIPGTLLDCFLKQDESSYIPTEDTPLPVDQVFVDSRAIVSVTSNMWQDGGAVSSTGAAVVLKEETKQSVMTMIDNLEKMAQNGNLCSVLQSLDVADADQMEMKIALKRLSQDEDRQNNLSSELDSILTNDIFDYIDSVLFKEQREDGLSASPPSCLTAGSNHLQDPFLQAGQLSATGLCESQMFQAPSPDCAYSPMNGVYCHQQDTMNGPVNGQSQTESAQIFSSTQKLHHHTPLLPQANTYPPLQHLQLDDIFSQSIELPQLTVPDASADDASAIFQSCGLTHMGSPQGVSGQTQSSQRLLCPQSNLQAAAMSANGHLLQNSIKQLNNIAPRVMENLPLLIPCNDFNSPSTPNIPVTFATACMQRNPTVETHSQQGRQWPQSQQQRLPPAGIVQNGHELMPACHNQISESQTLPHAGHWPRSITRLNHAHQGGLACGQATTHSSSLFDPHFSSSQAGGDVLALSRPSGLGGADMSLDQSPAQGSCYFQWSHSEPVVGTSVIIQENANISPLTAPSSTSSSEHAFNM